MFLKLLCWKSNNVKILIGKHGNQKKNEKLKTVVYNGSRVVPLAGKGHKPETKGTKRKICAASGRRAFSKHRG